MEKGSKITNRHTVWCIYFFESSFRFTFKLSSHKFGLFTVGCIITSITDHRVIFTSFRNGNELLRSFTTNCPTISLNDDKTQTAPSEDSSIGVSHLSVTDIHTFSISIETIEIFHDELTHT